MTSSQKHPGPGHRVASWFAVMLLFLMWRTPRVCAGVGQWTTGGPPAGPVAGLAVDPNDGAFVYAVANSKLFRSVNAGATWALSALDNVSVAAAGSNGLVYAATWSGFESVYRSFDGGVTWTLVLPAGNGSNVPTILKVDSLNQSVVYRATGESASPGGFRLGQLFRSLDAGTSWTDISVGVVVAGAVALDPTRSGVVYVSDFSVSGLYRSADFGSTWTLIGAGLVAPVTSVAVDPMSPSTLYASSSLQVFKSTDGGVSFVPVGGSLASNVSDLEINPVRSGGVFAGTLSNGVFSTSDGGATWVPFNTGLTNLGIYALGLDRMGTFLHAGTGNGVFDYQLGSAACVPDGAAACLQDARFRVSVAWNTPSRQSGLGQRLGITSNTTGFWFFDPTNVELVVKVLDGRQINGKWWVFYGALSNIEYSITVTDTKTGATRTYFNSQGQLASVADTAAF